MRARFLKEIPYSEDCLYENRGVNSRRVHSYDTCHNEVSRVTSSVIVGATAQYKCLQSRTHKLMRPKDLIFIVRYATVPVDYLQGLFVGESRI